MGVRKKRLTLKQIARALELTGGFISQAARDLDCTPRNLFRRIAGSQALQDIMWDIRCRYLDLAESKHLEQVKAGNYDAVKFHLRCQGKSRGYVERYEHQQFERIDHLKELVDVVRHGPIPRGQSYNGSDE
ncbi:MAG: hypothetical protein ABSB94_18925 [Syntrophorhabdales bacterium]|jgi:hypothetical protein